MANIVLTTLNAKYIHAAFGLRYLLANLGPLLSQAAIVEFDINQRATDIVEVLLAHDPKIVGVGVYIWNVPLSTEVVATLKRVRPDIIVILGGPEVSHEIERQPIVEMADYVITGEADLKFTAVCQQLLQGIMPSSKIIAAELPDCSRLTLPYDCYNASDIAHRIIYVEASRGCPFTCEFCLSSLDVPVRQMPLEPFLESLGKLLDRGVKQFKFVDRTFNLNLSTSKAILEFFVQRYRSDLFLHFEMIPDRLPDPLRELIARFPTGALQFEVGIQTFNHEVSHRIKRRQDYAKLADNLRFLREHTGVHIHADLIVGLPGESIASFGQGFDRLVALRPQEIQVGILKRLRGTPIVRHDAEWGMTYNPNPPYEILQNKLIDYSSMQRMRRFSRYWDLVSNSGNFIESAPLIWRDSDSAFQSFMRWSDWLYQQVGRNHGIALTHLAELLYAFLTDELKLKPDEAAGPILKDYQRTGRSDVPSFLRKYSFEPSSSPHAKRKSIALKRQRRHLAHEPRQSASLLESDTPARPTPADKE
jgi:radical SAM superfamily enzyme YgiQ (UPF0313 family)